jgi:hypothetical protein
MRDTLEYDADAFSDNFEAQNKGVYAKFFWHPVKDEQASAEAGRPIFVDKEYVQIVAAGNSTNIVTRKVTEMDIRRFKKYYDLFKQGDAEQLIGTPLTEVPWVTRAQVEEYAYRKIRTLEHLAELSDSECNMPGMYEMKRKAAAWLEKAKEAKPFTAMQAELKKQLAALTAPQKAATKS